MKRGVTISLSSLISGDRMINPVMSNPKMYICVHEDVPSFMVPTLVAHTILNVDTAYQRPDLYENIEGVIVCDNYRFWKKYSFKKCVLKVNSKEWKKIIQIPFVYLGHENSTLNGEKSCAILPIMDEYPNVVKFAKLWAP
jgi:hypothetical protein